MRGKLLLCNFLNLYAIIAAVRGKKIRIKKILYIVILIAFAYWLTYGKVQANQQIDEGYIVSDKEEEFIGLWESDSKKAIKIYKDKLKNGTNYEREVVLRLFEQLLVVDLIPDVIDAIEDQTISPFHGDTDWGFIGHQAAWSLLQT